MAIRAGLARDEYSVAAGELNQAFVGEPFGYNLPDGSGVLYGRLGAFAIGDNGVDVWLADVPSDARSREFTASPTEFLYFAQNEVRLNIERIATATEMKR